MNKITKLRLSASQLDTAKTCLLKWWLEKIAKCPQKFDRKLLLGEVGHGVCENLQEGRELYPEGWTSPTNRFTGEKSPHHITTTEQALVKALITKAIKEGILIKHPDTQTELEFPSKKNKKPVATVEGIDITFIGFIDHFWGNVVEDHKFIGINSPKYYTKKKLKDAIAMNLYAWASYEEGWITEPTCWLRYNLFVKDTADPRVITVEVEKTKEEIYEYYEKEIVPMFRPMALAAKNCTEWHQVESAMKQGRAKQACDKYGGDPLLSICLGNESVETYKARMKGSSIEDKKKGQKDILAGLLGNKSTKPNTTSVEKENKMPGLLQKIKKSGSQTAAPAPTKTEPEPTAQATATAATAQAPAPWAFHACPQCKDSATPGILDNKPCNICDICTSKELGRPVLEDYLVNVSDEGIVTWTEKVSEKVVAEVKVVEKEPVVKEVVESKGGEEFAEEPQVVGEEQVVAEEQAPVLPDAAEPKPEGSPLEALDPKGFEQERKGFILSYVRIQSRKRTSKKLGEGNCLLYPPEILEFVSGGLLKAANMSGAAAKDWYDIGYFDRRDLIVRNAKEIAEYVNNSMVDASDLIAGSDEENLIFAISRYAGIVIGNK